MWLLSPFRKKDPSRREVVQPHVQAATLLPSRGTVGPCQAGERTEETSKSKTLKTGGGGVRSRDEVSSATTQTSLTVLTSSSARLSRPFSGLVFRQPLGKGRRCLLSPLTRRQARYRLLKVKSWSAASCDAKGLVLGTSFLTMSFRRQCKSHRAHSGIL